MKERKFDLLKSTGCMILLSALLTWIIPQNQTTGANLTVAKFNRIGLTNFMQYGLIGIYYFTVLVTFLFVLGGFYTFLNKREGYKNLVNTIYEKIKGHEKLLVILTIFVFSLLSCITNDYMPLLVFIPFVISIFNKLKIDKITAFTSTFGGILVGTIGSVYSSKIVGSINNVFGTTYTDNIAYKIGLLILTYAILTFITVKNLKISKNAVNYDKFSDVKVSTKKSRGIRLYIILGLILTIVTILAYLPWEVWGVTVFNSITDWFNGLEILGVPVLTYMFGSFVPFGSWDLFTIQFLMLAIVLVLQLIEWISIDEILEDFAEGFKKMSSVVIILLAVYLVLEISATYAFLPTIAEWFAKITKGFNVFFTTIAVLISSLFSVEMQYATGLTGSYYASTFMDSSKLIAMIFQMMFGIVSFVAPTSAVLMMGLSYLNISYKEWVKYIWKFLCILMAIVIIMIILLAIL
jgi:uncharacterized ion transporter superfamily protein YfcC